MKFKEGVVGVVFVIVCFLAFNYTIIGRAENETNYPYKFKLYFPKIEGIREGDDVFIRGMLVGKVWEIQKVDLSQVPNPRFTPIENSAVQVTVISKRMVTIWDNYQIRFKTKTLFSNRHIDIDPGSPTEEMLLAANPYTEVSPSSEYSDDLMTIAYDVLKENRNDLRRIVNNIYAVSEKLKSKEGTLPKLINDDKLYEHLTHALYDIGIVSREGRRYIENQREIDVHPVTFVMVLIFQLTGLSLLGN
ncbi:MAG: MlaD family protein [Leptospiraceae bacterium]|nr:MlaD family protein [Leptospiraceae bacterium]